MGILHPGQLLAGTEQGCAIVNGLLLMRHRIGHASRDRRGLEAPEGQIDAERELPRRDRECEEPCRRVDCPRSEEPKHRGAPRHHQQRRPTNPNREASVLPDATGKRYHGPPGVAGDRKT